MSILRKNEEKTRLTAEFLAEVESYIEKNYRPEPEFKPMASASNFSGDVKCSVRHYFIDFSEFKVEEAIEEKETATAEESLPKPARKVCQKAEKRSVDIMPDWSVGKTFSEELFDLIDQRGLKDSEVYKAANISRQTFSKLKDTNHTPKKTTVFQLAIALKLGIIETRKLLLSAGYAFMPSNLTDVIVQFFIENGNYDMFLLEETLEKETGKTLANY